jgi:hypothetical protein
MKRVGEEEEDEEEEDKWYVAPGKKKYNKVEKMVS